MASWLAVAVHARASGVACVCPPFNMNYRGSFQHTGLYALMLSLMLSSSNGSSKLKTNCETYIVNGIERCIVIDKPRGNLKVTNGCSAM
eukprot:m.166343 g.166343  ORF g.166343 m.166343 type:complete len:89 (+) comp16619_c0_seq11:1735-2001(+)